MSASDLWHIVAGETGFADSGGVRIWYESIPADGHEKGIVLLGIGMAGHSLFWPPGFLRGFSRSGYRMIRYDQRGTGESGWMPEWSRRHAYSLLDIAADPITVLDALRIERAHVVGLSLGGFVAQEIAIGHPDRVISLTLMSTASDPTDWDLAGPRFGPMLRAGIPGLPLLRYRLIGGEKNLVKEIVAKTIAVNVYEGMDIQETAEFVLYELRHRRSINLRTVFQHQATVAVTRSRYESLGELRVPTMVIHGTADDFLPLAHARKLVELIPDAQHLWLEEVGQQFPYPDMPAITRKIVTHLDNAPLGPGARTACAHTDVRRSDRLRDCLSCHPAPRARRKAAAWMPQTNSARVLYALSSVRSSSRLPTPSFLKAEAS